MSSMKRYKNNKVTVIVETGRRFTVPHKKGGGGLHKDRRTKRQRTRGQENRAIIEEELEE